MKTALSRFFVLLFVAFAVCGCATTPQESAMEWMQKQPNHLDP